MIASDKACFFIAAMAAEREEKMRTKTIIGNMRVKAIIRLMVMIVLTVNAGLTLAGINPIPFDASAFTEAATQIAAGISIVWSWWKDAPITKEACEGTGYTRLLKLQKKGANGENFDDEIDVESEEK